MRTLKEEHVDYSDYEDFDDAQPDAELTRRNLYDRAPASGVGLSHTSGVRVRGRDTTVLPCLISGLIPSRKTAALHADTFGLQSSVS
jgi:hypothetical protein